MNRAETAHCLLGVDEMYRADRATIEAGTPGFELMERAGAAVADAIRKRWTPRPVAVLAGPGNNGGDGFVAGRHLAAAGWPVRVGLLGERDKLAGDAAWAADGWDGDIAPLAPDLVAGAGVIVDALFGAGLARPIEGTAAAVLEGADAADAPVVAVDVPSGVDGNSGAVLGVAARAALTVTFCRKKPGHLLLPGRLLAGETVVADIGIPDGVVAALAPRQAENHPDLWRDALRWPTLESHKYRRGHVLVFGGATMTGAGRLAARAALRAGAGMVTVACPPEKADTYLAATAALLAVPTPAPEALARLVADRRVAALVAGPGMGTDPASLALIEAALATGLPTVLDADAITAFAGAVDRLAGLVRGPVVLTPHDGEFARLFDAAGDKLTRTRRAAAQAGAVVVAKGGDTVVAEPASNATVNANAPPWLATAGAGDVLSGVTGALLAQQMPAFAAACAAVWMHGEAGTAIGPGLIADDLPDAIPTVISRLYNAPRGEVSTSRNC
jgi:hydroxyethylthiazole kinase-like uncharacterized protein yjeF